MGNCPDICGEGATASNLESNSSSQYQILTQLHLSKRESQQLHNEVNQLRTEKVQLDQKFNHLDKNLNININYFIQSQLLIDQFEERRQLQEAITASRVLIETSTNLNERINKQAKLAKLFQLLNQKEINVKDAEKLKGNALIKMQSQIQAS